MALTTEPWVSNFGTGTMTLKDGTGTPLTAVVQFDQGTLTLSGVKVDLRQVEKYEYRGVLTSVRKTGRAYPSGSFTCGIGEFSEASAGTVLDLIHADSVYSARVSTRTGGDVVTFDLDIAIEGTDFGGADGSLVLEDIDIGWDYSMGNADTLSFNFEVLGDISGDLSVAAA